MTLLGCLLFCGTEAAGQNVTESSLKAAFIHNFIRFTAWPPDALPPGAPLTVCVLGDASFRDVLESYVKGHPVDGHNILVAPITAEDAMRPCHLLYVSGIPARQAGRVAAGLGVAPVLTLSDLDQFARVGGMAQLSFEDGKIRFSINLEATRRSRLQLSSKLLSLARLVKDDPDAFTR